MSGEPLQPRTAVVSEDSWAALRQYTAARIALGRSGASLPTREVLAFEQAHAQARDAVLVPLDANALQAELEADGWRVLRVHSRAPDQAAYLARPDWGRRLNTDSLTSLEAKGGTDLVLVLSDGLSAVALQRHAAPLLRALAPLLGGLKLAPLVIASRARVALADEVGERLGVRVAVSLIGERPGLSSPDSLGAYLTHEPRVGRNDAERNCISNIRPQGLGYAEAALQLAALIAASLRTGLSGVKLKFDPSRAIGGQAV